MIERAHVGDGKIVFNVRNIEVDAVPASRGVDPVEVINAA
jgi:hypothetical protein